MPAQPVIVAMRRANEKRKLVEEIFGWSKTTGGFRKTRFKGVQRNNLAVAIVATAYNLLRVSRLAPALT